ncbi:alpha-amylase family protein [Candidatus Laterigemmans baculatus]|uniref:alpha-amylase family protein n=1 Tax=Candidatus Laterigemmans baculatus TaxID=2770505 RepID=UPI0013DB8BA1|nr:alpha-amylase family protein [Candidatus Laterigemmans baculatus]
MLDLWYKNAVIYCLDVETYHDSDHDGIGDFNGLNHRLEYLSGLGVTCLWLLPFYPSPNRDNGYDVEDYYNVDPRLGHLGDFVDFMHQAREFGMRVIIDLVVNHTSIDHPWFQQARSDPDSPYRDFYVWSEKKPADHDEGLIFPGFQKSTWTYDRKAKAYYFHRFYEHQAELNIANPRVRDEIRKIMGFWLELGVSGFRIDAAPFLIELKALHNVDVSDPFEYLEEFRNYLSWRRGDAILLAEANVSASDAIKYFGDGNKCQMLFNFLLNQHVMLSLAREEGGPLCKALEDSPEIPPMAQWANFLRNHDELTLNALDESQQQEVYAEFAPEESMKIYNRGIRRRLPPMVQGDQRRLQLSHSVLLSLPGTPVIRYGEEIGMGEDLSLPERNSIRTPMQWANKHNGGFSCADPDQLIRPPVSGGPFGYEQVNVAAQQRDPDSLLSITERMIRVRKECPEIGWGKCRTLETQDRQITAHQCEWRGESIIVVHNFGERSRTIRLDLHSKDGEQFIELLSDQPYAELESPADPIKISGYGYRWFRLGSDRR